VGNCKLREKCQGHSQRESGHAGKARIALACAQDGHAAPYACGYQGGQTRQRPQSKQAHSVFQSAPPIQPLQAASVRLAMTSADSHPTGWSEQTVLVIYSPKLYTLRYLADLFGIKSSYQIIMKTDSSATVDIEIRIGENWVGRLPPG